MSGREDIEFEDWLDFMFDRDNEVWCIYDIDDEPWLDRADLIAKHFVTLHFATSTRLERFSNDQLGWGLNALYIGSLVGEPLHLNGVGAAVVQKALLAVPHSFIGFILERCPQDELDSFSDPLSAAVFDFWDLVPLTHCLWQKDEQERLVYQAMLEETRRVLRIDHPLARFHALYGLGLFGRSGNRSVRADKTRIIVEWLATNPKIGPRVRDFAECAAFSKHF